MVVCTYFLGTNKIFPLLFRSGKHSQSANQESDTHNWIVAGTRVSGIYNKPVSEPNKKTFYEEQSLGVETEKPLVLQPG